MKKIQVFECDYCKKILRSRSGMKKHEEKCFYNEETKSCILCKHLSLQSFVDGRILTPHEENLLSGKIDGTYHIETGYEEADFNVLNEKYKYLYNSEPDNYCKSRKIRLRKLTTECLSFSK